MTQSRGEAVGRVESKHHQHAGSPVYGRNGTALAPRSNTHKKNKNEKVLQNGPKEEGKMFITFFKKKSK